MGQFVGFVVAEAKVVGGNSQRPPPVHPLFLPEFVPRFGLVRVAEPFHFHLLKLAASENVVPRGHFVAKGLSDLRDSKGQLDPHRVADVGVVQENPLGRLGTQVGLGVVILNRPDVRGKHQVEFARFAEGSVLPATRAGFQVFQMIGAEAGAAVGAIDFQIVESGGMPRGLPCFWVLDDGRIHSDDLQRVSVGSYRGAFDHVSPPAVAEVVFQLHAERAVVPEPVDSPVDF